MDVDPRIAIPRQTPVLQEHQSSNSCGRILQDVRRPSGCTMERGPSGRGVPRSPQRPATRAMPRVRSPGPSRAARPAPPARTAPPVWPLPAPVRAVTIVVIVVRARCPAERRVQLLDRVGQHRLVAAPQHGKAERPVERRQVARPEPPGLALAQPDAGHARAVGQLVVERHGVAAHAHHRGKRVEPLARGFVHERRGSRASRACEEVVPAVHASRAARG